MKRQSFENQPCTIARSVDILGDWWTPLIIREALYGITRFADFEHWLGIKKNMLSSRLKQLVEQGIFRKVPYQEHPPRFEYRLTEKGFDAAQVLISMMSFGAKWMFPDQEAPILLYHRHTHQEVTPQLVDAKTGEALDVRTLYAGPGASFPQDETLRRARFRTFYREPIEEEKE